MNNRTQYKFRLYISGLSPNSVQAVANLNALCREHLAGRHEIEIVDVLKDPKRALSDSVLLTPTLVKLSPAPERKMVGALSSKEAVLDMLGLSIQQP